MIDIVLILLSRKSLLQGLFYREKGIDKKVWFLTYLSVLNRVYNFMGVCPNSKQGVVCTADFDLLDKL